METIFDWWWRTRQPLAREGLCILCCVLERWIRNQHQILVGKKIELVQEFIAIQSFGHPGFTTLQLFSKVQEFLLNERRTRRFHRTDHLHVDNQWHLMRIWRQWTGMQRTDLWGIKSVYKIREQYEQRDVLRGKEWYRIFLELEICHEEGEMKEDSGASMHVMKFRTFAHIHPKWQDHRLQVSTNPGNRPAIHGRGGRRRIWIMVNQFSKHLLHICHKDLRNKPFIHSCSEGITKVPCRRNPERRTDNSVEFTKACEDLWKAWHTYTNIDPKQMESQKEQLVQSELGADWETSHERRYDWKFWYPISTKDKNKIHQISSKSSKGVFTGYALNKECGWTGDLPMADAEEVKDNMHQKSTSEDSKAKRWRSKK